MYMEREKAYVKANLADWEGICSSSPILESYEEICEEEKMEAVRAFYSLPSDTEISFDTVDAIDSSSCTCVELLTVSTEEYNEETGAYDLPSYSLFCCVM